MVFLLEGQNCNFLEVKGLNMHLIQNLFNTIDALLLNLFLLPHTP